jgi:hypothetical protein
VFCSKTEVPTNSSAITVLTLFTAFKTPFPKNAFPPSRNSTASCSPVEAPDGTAALPKTPFSVTTSTSIVGLPLDKLYFFFEIIKLFNSKNVFLLLKTFIY